MTDFFKSEMVRGDLQNIMELQRYCFQASVAFPVLSKEKKMEYFNILSDLIEKQKIFTARLSLSDDKEAMEMIESMRDMVVMLGGNPNDSLTSMFDDLQKKVEGFKQQLEAEG